MRLHAELPSMTWTEFRDLVRGLLNTDTRLHRKLAPKQEEERR